LSSYSKNNQYEIREKLIEELEADLIGPRFGDTPEKREHEILPPNRRPHDEYFAGVLFPGNWEVEDEEIEQESGGDSNDEDNVDANVASDKLFKPSSFGLYCRLTPETKEINVVIKYGMYQSFKNKDERKYFKRTPKSESFKISIKPTKETEIQFKNNPKFCINYTILEDSGKILLDFYVINKTERNQNGPRNPVTDFIFQPQITLESLNNELSFMSITDGLRKDYNPPSDKHLDILFRHKVSFGKGHLCAVVWDRNNIKNSCIDKISTSFIPQDEIDFIEPNETYTELNSSLEMYKLGTCSIRELQDMLFLIIQKYNSWIEETKQKISSSNDLDDGQQQIVIKEIEKSKTAISRMNDAVDLLEKDSNAFDAFQFANKAIAWQQVHGKWAASNTEKGDVEGTDPIEKPEPIFDDKKPAWRLFQIAFILMNLESITNPKSDYRNDVDLLWFPTGGGKTEAYLGLIAFTIAYRRLRGRNEQGQHTYESYGTAVLMRYTLRLLTIQQFQRAATLMCACEELRIKDQKKWGGIPFQVGLWVGGSVTPNSRMEAINKKYEIRGDKLEEIQNNNPYILINCPWCGKKLRASSGDECGEPKQWRLFCPRNSCTFSKHLDSSPDIAIPVVLIDEDIYHRCPSLIISTVDKFAQIALNAKVRSIFGKIDTHCDYCGFLDSGTEKHASFHKDTGGRKAADYIDQNITVLPPELIVQDELHLISGPLGTLTGLYETALEYLCSNNGIKPKIIASTATTRAAEDQITKLFNRDQTRIFPPQIEKFGETFFSRINSDKSGKKYLGFLATGKSGLTVLARVSAVILRRIRQFEEDGTYDKKDLDPYFTLVSYFNSQRELGGAAMSFKDSVPNFMKQIYNLYDYTPPKISEDDALTTETEESEEDPKTESPKTPYWEKLRGYCFQNLITEELTSRKKSGEIPQVLRKLGDGIENSLPPKDGNSDENQPIDLLLATNMLSVGVDIPRLGAMVVNGQPKLNSEYIQATGRIGRANPGLIVTLYAYTKPRDLSYYENFKDFHSTYYKEVETVSLTPFTLRARQIGLFGIMVGLARMLTYSLSKQSDANRFNQTDRDQQQDIENIKLQIEKRVASIEPDEASDTKDNIINLLNRWANEVKYHQSNLLYREPYNEKTSNTKLEGNMYLLKTDSESKRQLIPTPSSLRSAEQEHNLRYLDVQEVEDENE
tara:strand:- start:1519 stop:5082 length:3564 start_codon:yes stop_codon:yes gene_type:complete